MELPSRNTRSRNESSSSVSDVVSDLPNIAPDWGITLFSMLNGSIKLLDNIIVAKFNSKLQKSMDTANNALRKPESIHYTKYG